VGGRAGAGGRSTQEAGAGGSSSAQEAGADGRKVILIDAYA
jgi:hypothetical protein